MARSCASATTPATPRRAPPCAKPAEGRTTPPALLEGQKSQRDYWGEPPPRDDKRFPTQPAPFCVRAGPPHRFAMPLQQSWRGRPLPGAFEGFGYSGFQFFGEGEGDAVGSVADLVAEEGADR